VFNRLFSTSDDLSLDLPGAQDKPSIQSWELRDLDSDGQADDPLARQSRGNYSWIITLSPTTADARDALATDPSAHSYEVSVVVFYRRPLAVTTPTAPDEVTANRDVLRQNERAVRAKIVSTGLSGGEVLLEKYYNDPEAESPYANLKTGQWVLLCGPHPNSTDVRPMMVARWYRVLAIDKEPNDLISDPDNQRVVALRGPEWPWQPAPPPGGLGNDAHLSNALYVCIPTGAVAVHAKTIRLEGDSVWSGGANGLGGTPPPAGTKPPHNGTAL
jgi:hypothetical protein